MMYLGICVLEVLKFMCFIFFYELIGLSFFCSKLFYKVILYGCSILVCSIYVMY